MTLFCSQCDTCKLKGKRPVMGDGPLPSVLMMVGEAPGENEDRIGKPFQGRAGNELNAYCEKVDLCRSIAYISNVVKCRPPKNRDPEEEEINFCAGTLLKEIQACKPRVIAALGKFATQYFLNTDKNMDYVHGIPYRVSKLANGIGIPETIVVPCFHPAAGLHNPEKMSDILADLRMVSDVLRGYVQPRETVLQRSPTYILVEHPHQLPLFSNRVAIDTEWAKGGPWCITFSVEKDKAYMVMADNIECVKLLGQWWNRHDVECDIHNALYDVLVLWSLGIHPKNIYCTMVMAYLLQTEPQGLKPLAYRHLNIEMDEYKEVVGPANTGKNLRYLANVLTMDWEDPDPIERWVKGVYKPKYPKNIRDRVKKILLDFARKSESDNPEDHVNLYKRWHTIKYEEGRGAVEKILGEIETGDLSDIPFEKAKAYASQDADVLYQLKPLLWDRIKAYKLEDAFFADMGIIQMVSDMMRTGVKIDREHMSKLSVEFCGMKDTYNGILDMMVGKHVNPNSPKQICDLLVDKHIFAYPQTTNGKHLEKFRFNPIVDMILKCRMYSKLNGTYAVALPRLADEYDRIHPTIRTTRVATGRLSASDPNLMNIPTRSKDGKRIKAGLIVDPGNMVLSLDYSQIELRVLAHVSRDKNMIDCFLKGMDLHKRTASDMFGVPIEEVTDSQRYPAKSINFGIAYGLTESGLFRDLNAQGLPYSLDQCKAFIERWFSLYPDVYYYIDNTKAEAKRTGMVRDMFGRIRFCPEGYSADIWIQRAGERQAINTPIQSGAQGIMKRAMAKITPFYLDITKGGMYTLKPLMQVHDALYWEVSEEIVNSAAYIIQDVMEHAVELRVPTPTSCEKGYNWKELEKFKPKEIYS